MATAAEKPAEEATAESGGVSGGEEQGTGKGEEEELEERSGDETPGSEAPGDKAAEEQGDVQDSEKSKPAGSDGERRGVKRQWDEKDEHRFYGRDYEYNRCRDYYRQYNLDWQNYYYHHPQDRDRYYRNYYGYQGYQ